MNEKEYLKHRLRQAHIGGTTFKAALIIATISFLSSLQPDQSTGQIFALLFIVTLVASPVIWLLLRKKEKTTPRKLYGEVYIPEQNESEKAVEKARIKLGKLVQTIGRIENHFNLPQELHPYLSRLYTYIDHGRANNLLEARDVLVVELEQEMKLAKLDSQYQEMMELERAMQDAWNESRQARIEAEVAENEQWLNELQQKIMYFDD